MDVKDILEQWKEDSKIDRLELQEGSLRTQELHSKYIDIYFYERARLLQLKDRYNKMKRLRHEYWLGLLSQEELKEHGWAPQPQRIAKQDIDLYLDSDEVLSKISLQFALQQEKLNVIDSIIKTIGQRGFHINSAIVWNKFVAGQ